MGIEMTRADRKINKELREFPKATDTTSKSKQRKRRRRQKKTSPVQKLFQTCKEVFANGGAGTVPSHEDIERLRAVLDEMKPEDVGLSPDMPCLRTQGARRTPKITYLQLYGSDKFSMEIFCLPPSGVIPLHDHPGMTVFSKILFGTMHINSYDWVDGPIYTSADLNSSEITAPAVRLAKMKVDSDFTAPCNTSILYPADGGNMHCFTAVTACAVLDVFFPPYSEPDGRPCTYYLEFPFTSFSVDGVSVPEEEREGYAWLQEREMIPEDVSAVRARYRGPEIVDK